MKSIIRYLVLILISVNISSGYELHETSKFIDDIKIIISLTSASQSQIAEYEWEELNKARRARTYIEAAGHGRSYTLAKMLHSKKQFANKEAFLRDLDELELKLFGYITPNTASLIVQCKVLVKYAEDNPGELTKLPMEFIDIAFKDSWGDSN